MSKLNLGAIATKEATKTANKIITELVRENRDLLGEMFLTSFLKERRGLMVDELSRAYLTGGKIGLTRTIVEMMLEFQTYFNELFQITGGTTVYERSVN